MSRSLTRMQVIQEWMKNDIYLDHYVCPDCRDILTNEGEDLSCGNVMCGNENTYNIITGEEIN